MILTGGQGTDSLVTEYTNLGTAEKVIVTHVTHISLSIFRFDQNWKTGFFKQGDCNPLGESHGSTPPSCMWCDQDVWQSGQEKDLAFKSSVSSSLLKMLIVTGGFQGHSLDSTELMDYTSGIAGRWWPAHPLPSPRDSLRGSSMDGLFYVAGGNTYPDGLTTEVLLWDPAAETWAEAGQLESARQRHALASVSLQLLTSVAPGCSFVTRQCALAFKKQIESCLGKY